MRRLIITAAIAASSIGAIALPSAASAAVSCPSGSFCANTDANFTGLQVNWTGDDGWWEGNIADEDSAWANRGVTGPGVPSTVKVYASAWQGGGVTICLPAGATVNHNADANDRGDSHEWTTGGC